MQAWGYAFGVAFANAIGCAPTTLHAHATSAYKVTQCINGKFTMTTDLNRESDQPMEEEALIRRSMRSIVCVGKLVSRKGGVPS